MTASGETKRGRMVCARFLRAVAHSVRRLILEAPVEHSQCVEDRNALVPIAQPRFSWHAAALRGAELIDSH